VNNLKQIGLGLHNVHSSENRFPPGANDNGATWTAWLARFYEQGNLADAMWILPEGGHWDDGVQTTYPRELESLFESVPCSVGASAPACRCACSPRAIE